VIRAVLSGGLVLGVGAAVTLAAWNDSEFATGSFQAGSFNIQGTADDPAGSNPDWSDHATTGTALGLTFRVNADALTPGQSVYAPMSLRVDPAKNSYDANVTLPSAPTVTGDLGADLTTKTYVSTYANCAGGAPGTSEFSNGTLSKDGTAQTVCLVVSMNAGAPATAQGTSATVAWQFDAASVTP
jgi:predicted ribosomally synthesized peptide with SipW-like signal peptide